MIVHVTIPVQLKTAAGDWVALILAKTTFEWGIPMLVPGMQMKLIPLSSRGTLTIREVCLVDDTHSEVSYAVECAPFQWDDGDTGYHITDRIEAAERVLKPYGWEV